MEYVQKERIGILQQEFAETLCIYAGVAARIANISFSWWAAYISDVAENKRVYYPSTWFGPDANNVYPDDMFPKDWIKI